MISSNTPVREFQHARTGIDTIDFDLRMRPKQFAKQTAIAFTYDEGSRRTGDLIDPTSASALEHMAKRSGLQNLVNGRDPIEVHMIFLNANTTNGVSKRRSASAVR